MINSIVTHLLAAMVGAIVTFVAIALCTANGTEDEKLNTDTNNEI